MVATESHATDPASGAPLGTHRTTRRVTYEAFPFAEVIQIPEQFDVRSQQPFAFTA